MGKILLIIDVIFIIITIYYKNITTKREKEYIGKLQKDYEDTPNDEIVTEEEFAEMNKEFIKNLHKFIIKPSNILTTLTITITILTVLAVALIIIL